MLRPLPPYMSSLDPESLSDHSLNWKELTVTASCLPYTLLSQFRKL